MGRKEISDLNETFGVYCYIFQQTSQIFSKRYMSYYAWYKHFAEAPRVCIWHAARKTQIAISI